ncbi:hypothetical protein [Rubrivirga sp.]|uniref:hypothetical protein n=1 Tax=Rubrivirga sp. TaxID=1885344 RepID=UPI003C71CD16
MPMVLALLALLAVADTTLPAGAYGTWVNADTVTTKHEFNGEDGLETYVNTVLYRHLVVSDSTLADTIIQDDDTGAMAYLFTTPYRVEDGRLVLEGDSISIDLDLEGDTLTLTVSGVEDVPPPQRYVRAAPPEVPPELIGTWEGGVVDDAGVVAGVRIAFHDDGTATVSPDGDTIRFDMVGPYLLLEEPSHEAYFDEEMIAMRVGHAKVDGDRLELAGLGDDPLYMVRVPSPKR